MQKEQNNKTKIKQEEETTEEFFEKNYVPFEEKLVCSLCGQQISNKRFAHKIGNTDGICCLDCYIEKGVMATNVGLKIDREKFIERYGESATTEKRYFGKKG